MNRTGLFIALSIALVIGVVFAIYPELDLKLAALFYDMTTKNFPLKASGLAALARDAAMWVVWALVIPALGALAIKIVRPDRPLLMSGRAIIFLTVTLALSSGVLSNFVFKSHWGRPRPVVVTQFNNGQFDKLDFVPWWDPRGGCGWDFLFFSREGAAPFWTYAPAALTPPPWRPPSFFAAPPLRGPTRGVAVAVRRPLLPRVPAARD